MNFVWIMLLGSIFLNFEIFLTLNVSQFLVVGYKWEFKKKTMIKKIFYYIYYPVWAGSSRSRRTEPLRTGYSEWFCSEPTEPVAPLFGTGTEPREPSPSLVTLLLFVK